MNTLIGHLEKEAINQLGSDIQSILKTFCGKDKTSKGVVKHDASHKIFAGLEKVGLNESFIREHHFTAKDRIGISIFFFFYS